MYNINKEQYMQKTMLEYRVVFCGLLQDSTG